MTIAQTPPRRRGAAPAEDWRAETAATLRLAWPLIAAQLATMALTTTDVVMMGWLGPDFLAGGSLATSGLYPLLMFGHGVVLATAPMIAQAVGGRRPRQARGAVRQGLWVALALCLVLIPILLQGERLFLALGQAPRIAALAGDYLDYAAWSFAPALMFVVLRGLVSAHGETRAVLRITVAGVFVNALGNYLLMFGHFGLPRLELKGAGIATTIVHAAMFGLLMRHVLRRAPYRRLALLGRICRPDWARFRAILTLGAPIGLMMAAESGLFAGAAVLMGWLGAEALAAHAVALQLAALAFMAPLGLSHATTIRVGLAHGHGDRRGVARAGWTSIGLAVGFMSMTAALFWFAPEALVALFLDPLDPASAAPTALAVSYLAIAALFQLADGVQVAAAAALRGVNDTATPMAVALVGYWAIGLPVAWALGFPLGFEGVGIWLGLASGLAVAAAVLSLRFALRLRG